MLCGERYSSSLVDGKGMARGEKLFNVDVKLVTLIVWKFIQKCQREMMKVEGFWAGNENVGFGDLSPFVLQLRGIIIGEGSSF